MDLEKQYRDQVKQAVHNVCEKTAAGEVPDELLSLYGSLGGEKYGYWLHGFCCAVSRDPFMRKSELRKFLTKEFQES